MPGLLPGSASRPEIPLVGRERERRKESPAHQVTVPFGRGMGVIIIVVVVVVVVHGISSSSSSSCLGARCVLPRQPSRRTPFHCTIPTPAWICPACPGGGKSGGTGGEGGCGVCLLGRREAPQNRGAHRHARPHARTSIGAVRALVNLRRAGVPRRWCKGSRTGQDRAGKGPIGAATERKKERAGQTPPRPPRHHAHWPCRNLDCQRRRRRLSLSLSLSSSLALALFPGLPRPRRAWAMGACFALVCPTLPVQEAG